MIRLLQENTGVQLLNDQSMEVKSLVYEMSYGLTVEKAMSAPKIFQVKKKLGQENLIKLLAVIVKSFCDSVKAKQSMDVVDIFECSELLCETYTHDSVKDIVMALKIAKKDGKIMYNVITTGTIFEIITAYMENKSAHTEKREADAKSKNDGSVRTEAYSISVGQEMAQQRKEKMFENKELKEVQAEKREIKKIQNIIEKTVDKL